MPAESDTERVAVKTYVPAYQRERWRDHADQLDMSLSEFLRTMTQAGRRGFDVEAYRAPAEESHDRQESGGDGSSGDDPQGLTLEDRVVEVLRSEGVASWDALCDSVTEELEERLDELLTRLQDQDRVRYSGREGGYTLVDA